MNRSITQALATLRAAGFDGRFDAADIADCDDDEFVILHAGRETAISIQCSNEGSFTRSPYYIVTQWVDGGHAMTHSREFRSMVPAVMLALEDARKRLADGTLYEQPSFRVAAE